MLLNHDLGQNFKYFMNKAILDRFYAQINVSQQRILQFPRDVPLPQFCFIVLLIFTYIVHQHAQLPSTDACVIIHVLNLNIYYQITCTMQLMHLLFLSSSDFMLSAMSMACSCSWVIDFALTSFDVFFRKKSKILRLGWSAEFHPFINHPCRLTAGIISSCKV